MSTHPPTPADQGEGVGTGRVSRWTRSRIGLAAASGLALLLVTLMVVWPSDPGVSCEPNKLPKPLEQHPDATTAGVPEGTTLTTVDGDFHTKTDGQVIDRLEITGELYIHHDDVKVKCTRVWEMTTNEGDNLKMWLSTLGDPEGVDNGSALKKSDYTLRRVEIMGTYDGLKAEGDVDVRDSYIHDLYRTKDDSQDNGWTHNDGVQIDRGSDMVFKHNTFDMWSFTDRESADEHLFKTPFGNGDGYTTSAFMISAKKVDDVVIEDNLIRGRTSRAVHVTRAKDGVEVIGNIVGREGRDYPEAFSVTAGTEVEDNVFDNGEPAKD